MNVIKVQIFVLMWVGLLIAAASRSPWMADDCGRLDVNWSVDRGDYTYRLRGQYTVASLSGDWVASLSSDAAPGAAEPALCVPPGLYRVTLEPGYTLERRAAEPAGAAQAEGDGASAEVVPATLVSPNPAVVRASEGRAAAMGLSLVDMPATASEPDATCMNGS